MAKDKEETSETVNTLFGLAQPNMGAIPQFPVTIDGWTKRLIDEYDTKQIKEIVALHASGLLQEATTLALQKTEKMPFDVFWEAYKYKVGSKSATQKIWDKYAYKKQEFIVNVAIPKYQRFIDVSGISKCMPIVYLRQRRFLDEIPDKEQISKFAKTVERFFEDYLQWKKKYPLYQREHFDTLFRATEAFMYRYPNMTPIEVCGVLRWMAKTWESQYRHLIKPSRAMVLMKWPGYHTSASYEIEMLKRDRDRRKNASSPERDVEREKRTQREEEE